ncbi:MAG: SCO family protein [Candidatus Acidiferrales bacterium]
MTGRIPRIRCSQIGISAFFFFAFLAATNFAQAAQRYAETGLVLKVDRAKQTVIVSCDSIPDVMDAMIMPLDVRDNKSLDGLQPGMKIEFTLVAADDDHDSYAENIRIRPYESMENDPSAARRLTILEKMLDDKGPMKEAIATGQPVPDFALTDQNHQRVKLSQFAGQVVAVNFVYVRCPFPNYCFRLSTNFARLQERFRKQLGSDLVLLTLIIDPVHDSSDSVRDYARIWHADPQAWHFLAGSPSEIQQVCALFDMNYYPDEALLLHSFHTVVIDRHGKLASNIEGNDFSAQQLGDLVQTVMNEPR